MLCRTRPLSCLRVRSSARAAVRPRVLASARSSIAAHAANQSRPERFSPFAPSLPQARLFATDAALMEMAVPDLGAESITEGTIMEWKRAVGDPVNKGDVIAVIETDKVTVEVNAPESGTIESLIVEEGAVCEVGKPLVVIRVGAGGTAPTTPSKPAPATTSPSTAPTPTPAPQAKAKAPAAKKPAADKTPKLSGKGFYFDAIASGANAHYMESLYMQWKANPSQVDPSWSQYFMEIDRGGSAGPATAESMALASAVRAYQVYGHKAANLDPLGLSAWKDEKEAPRELDPDVYGFFGPALDAQVSVQVSDGGTTGILASVTPSMTFNEVFANLKKTYCGTVGVEYMHIQELEKQNWIRDRVESESLYDCDKATALRVFERLCYADTFETFLGKNFKTTKRFGVDGGESVIPGLNALVDRAAELGCENFVIGMPHRGRLNVMAHVLGKPLPQILSEFKGTHYNIEEILDELEGEDWSSSGDVKYHLGTSNERVYPDGRTVRLSLEANPSHLETVDPITLGRTRAKQYFMGNTDECTRKVMPILMHGDAAFAGQGIVYETMQLAKVEDFDVGGTVHVVVNNQVGFTTDPQNSRTMTYCSDIGKGFGIPIFHCNGDDPVAVCRAFEIAAEWRQQWGEDVILDVICYRRFGHNEIDNPDFTQPLLYKQIKKHPRTEALTAQRLVEQGLASQAEIDEIRSRVLSKYEESLTASESWVPEGPDKWVATPWPGYKVGASIEALPRPITGVEVDLLRKVGEKLYEFPAGFTPHPQLKRQFDTKLQRVAEGSGLDWGACEGLAFGTLLLEGIHVRITGQDVERGTFSHRHCFVRDNKTGDRYGFLNSMNLGNQAEFIARNSVLSEYGVLGFELGYSYENPNTLIMWEGQFGDFANTAQVIFDQYLSAGEHKWLQQSGLTVLLPHGYDGQGAEHSSCRIERFLQMCDDDEDDIPRLDSDSRSKQAQSANMAVCNITTPANYFHALRRQTHRKFRKPLIVAAPKNLLRHKMAVSSFEEMAPGTAFKRLISERDPEIANNPDKVDRLVFCTGKIYYELVEERAKHSANNIAIITLEQIAPFPFDQVVEEMTKYSNVDHGDGIAAGSIVWCQEEPKNMGAWAYVRPRLVTSAREGMDSDTVIAYVGRRAAASPATGLAKLHAAEQSAVVSEALFGSVGDGKDRGSMLLGHRAA
eukprot:gnl/MRDRNA2_/MRDRNA2_103542_c0_seq1.p1 gnl/MRDRNA2_/MRDRNA2_103542_c0~~gnl/MRDRNA2_/MRDRNA2_103542_c0_seq1.p1  ORF type:complete len:1180 (+),score=256.97 gnl/MRDRNA2_/MRDRNA2_103542_c0_seq1:123-3662(+)